MKKAKKRIFSATLAIMFLLVCACPASAATGPQYLSVTTTSTYSNGVFAVVTVSSVADATCSVPGVQIVHQNGSSTTYTASGDEDQSKSATASLGCTASLNLGSGIDTIIHNTFREYLLNNEGLADSEEYNFEPGDKLVVEGSAADGNYGIVICFPGAHVEKEVIGVNQFGFETNIWAEDVDYAPQANQSYYVLTLVE